MTTLITINVKFIFSDIIVLCIFSFTEAQFILMFNKFMLVVQYNSFYVLKSCLNLSQK